MTKPITMLNPSGERTVSQPIEYQPFKPGRLMSDARPFDAHTARIMDPNAALDWQRQQREELADTLVGLNGLRGEKSRWAANKVRENFVKLITAEPTEPTQQLPAR